MLSLVRREHKSVQDVRDLQGSNKSVAAALQCETGLRNDESVVFHDGLLQGLVSARRHAGDQVTSSRRNRGGDSPIGSRRKRGERERSYMALGSSGGALGDCPATPMSAFG